jgi:NAD-dependent deacetylase
MTPEARLVELLQRSTRTLVFSGAGISTGSGIPDFRGPQGVWTRRQPVFYDEFLASEERRVEYWDQKAETFEAFRDARPNAAHLAIVELHRRGRLAGVVTQNIDGLHKSAGLPDDAVIELHGTNLRVECLRCDALHDPAPFVERFRRERCTPLCTCGGLTKFATISFGQSLKEGILERAFALAGEADLVLALGSTLSVYPAAAVPLLATQSGAPYVVINRGATDHDHLATLRLEGDVAEILPPAVGAIRD